MSVGVVIVCVGGRTRFSGTIYEATTGLGGSVMLNLAREGEAGLWGAFWRLPMGLEAIDSVFVNARRLSGAVLGREGALGICGEYAGLCG